MSGNTKDQIDLDFAMRGEVAPGRIGKSSNGAHAGHHENSEKSSAQKDDLARLIAQLNDLQIQLCNQADYFHKLINQLMEDRAVALSSLDALNVFLYDFRKDGDFEMGPGGYPVDEKVRGLIIAYEQKSGKTFDPYDPDTINEFLRAMIKDQENVIEGFDSQISETQYELDRTMNALNTVSENLDAIAGGTIYSVAEMEESILELKSTIHADSSPEQEPSRHQAEISINLTMPSF